MTMPDWWTTRRLGLFVHANLATVPAWAPIGEYAEWYRSHLGDELDDVTMHQQPLVEVLAHHRERWGHIEHYDDFAPLLSFDRFDPEEWAGLATDLGAGYSVLVAKHHDGWSWWDSPNGSKRLVDVGPERNVLAEYAAACERHRIVFGTYYSLLDWGDERYPSDHYVSDVLHRDVVDLVERYGSSVLWGDGHWGHGPDVWRTGELLDRVRRIDPEIVVNDRWWASSVDLPEGAPDVVRTYEYLCPEGIPEGPWELNRGIAMSFGHNRNERDEHHMTGLEIVDLYTEVLAKGGNLLLDVGPASDGTVPEMQSAPLRDAGTFIRRFDDVLCDARPWDRWGDADSRILRASDGSLVGVDVTGRGRFDAFAGAGVRVVSVERLGGDGTPVDFVHDADGLRLDRRTRKRDPHAPSDDPIGVDVFRFTTTQVDRPVELFEPVRPSPVPLAPLLDGASAGDIVQLGDGVYLGPATVPDGVVLRGLGAGRTVVRPTTHGIMPTEAALTVAADAGIEHLEVSDDRDHETIFERVAPRLVDLRGDRSSALGCTVRGHLDVHGDDVRVRAVTARGVVALDADRLSLSRCTFVGNRWDVGVRLVGGGGHRIESSDLSAHLCAIRATDTTGTDVRHNTIDGRWWGVHLEHTEDAHVHGNRMRSTMRSVDVDGGTNAVVDGNASVGGDSGCVVQNGAARTVVSGNHWERCRVGLIAWEAVDLDHSDNVCVDLLDDGASLVVGP